MPQYDKVTDETKSRAACGNNLLLIYRVYQDFIGPCKDFQIDRRMGIGGLNASLYLRAHNVYLYL